MHKSRGGGCHLCSHERHTPGSLREPLVPAHRDADLGKFGLECLEASVARVEVELLLVPAAQHRPRPTIQCITHVSSACRDVSDYAASRSGCCRPPSRQKCTCHTQISTHSHMHLFQCTSCTLLKCRFFYHTKLVHIISVYHKFAEAWVPHPDPSGMCDFLYRPTQVPSASNTASALKKALFARSK